MTIVDANVLPALGRPSARAVDVWCQAPNVVHPEPGRGFAAAFAPTMTSEAAPGNLVVDADLAAPSTQHDAAVANIDRDFARFPKVATVLPGVRLDDAR